MHLLSSSDHCSGEDVDSLENELQPILLEIESTPKEDDFVLVKFESAIQGAYSSRAAVTIYYVGRIVVVHGKEYEIKFLRRTKRELFVYPKSDDVVHVHEKDVKAILYVIKQAKTMAYRSDIVHLCCLWELFPRLININFTIHRQIF